MEQSYISYYKKGAMNAKEVFKNPSNLFKYYLLLIASFIGKLFIFPSPIFDLAMNKTVKSARLNDDINLTKSFRKADDKRLYSQMLISKVIFLGLAVAGVVLIGLLTLFLVILGDGINIFGVTENVNIKLIFAIPGIIGIVIFLIIISLWYAPLTYLFNTSPAITASQALFSSVNSMKSNNKKIFLINFHAALINILYLGALALICYLSYLFLDITISQFIIRLLIIIFGLVYLYKVLPVTSLSRKMATQECFESFVKCYDIKIDEAGNEEVVVSKGKTYKAKKREYMLKSLFTDNDDKN